MLLGTNVFDAEATELTTLVCLKEGLRGDVQGGEPAFAIGPSVDADGTGLDEWEACFLCGVATDKCLAGEMRVSIIETPPEEPVVALIGKWEHRIDAGMGEDVRVGFEKPLALVFHEMPMRIRHGFEVRVGCTDVARHGLPTAHREP